MFVNFSLQTFLLVFSFLLQSVNEIQSLLTPAAASTPTYIVLLGRVSANSAVLRIFWLQSYLLNMYTVPCAVVPRGTLKWQTVTYAECVDFEVKLFRVRRSKVLCWRRFWV